MVVLFAVGCKKEETKKYNLPNDCAECYVLLNNANNDTINIDNYLIIGQTKETHPYCDYIDFVYNIKYNNDIQSIYKASTIVCP